MHPQMLIDELIDIVRKGGCVKTGLDVFNARDVLLLEKDALVNNINVLLILKQNGLQSVPICPEAGGGAWDANGRILTAKMREPASATGRDESITDLHCTIQEINQLRHEARTLQDRATENAKKVITDIKRSGGEFDQSLVEETVDDIFVFLTKKEQAFAYLTKELFSYDNYLYNHSVNVCTLGIAVLKRYNDQFCELINKYLNDILTHNTNMTVDDRFTSFILYYPDELRQIAIGYFLHDIGKVLLPEEILNKTDPLTPAEFSLIQTHSTDLGLRLIRQNMIYNIYVENIVKHHHAALFKDDERSYPAEKLPIEIPPYVKICKLVDIYDAMTSKRSYKDAINPIIVVTNIFRRFAKKDALLQIVLHAFMRVVGIYPPGSIVYLQNGQLAYILQSDGPVYLPFTDENGNPLQTRPEPIDLTGQEIGSDGRQIDRRHPPVSPREVYDILPDYLKG